MKATFAVRLLLLALLTGLGVGGTAMSQAQEKSPATSSAVQKTKATPPKTTQAATKKAEATPKKAQPKKTVPTKKAATKKSRSVSNEVVKTRLPPAKLDLSLPQELVNKMQPVGKVPLSKSRPLLPQMFVEKPASQTPFQLNGRLLSNEMDLQLRNESRREVEGAALDFEFKQ
ncbi:hypothetical protein SAMN05216598_5625 [Pseudomonas asplenii]|uniref:Translation initiation factor 2 n=1 Tax=Pseudomonas asplenii TaxID=53407 RepID=A0A1H2A8C5_9PSED|nr:hypothetical protein [Pseudomonas asplenii]SDT42230.1 hypothetical protein SAMN05216598_5625 [Pseudomonas asplenii]